MNNSKADISNIYNLNGRVPLGKAVPFGLQHILAMFVANIAPLIIVANACHLGSGETAKLIQTTMVIAGIGTLIQLFPIWKVGSGLPIVMGISFTFVSVACTVGAQYGYKRYRRRGNHRRLYRGDHRSLREILDQTHHADCFG